MKTKTAIYNRWWFWVVVGLIIIVVVANLTQKNTVQSRSITTTTIAPTPPPTTSPATPTTAPPSTAPPSTVPPTTTTVIPSGISGIRIGPGPMVVYAVQPQPAPGTCHYTYAGPDPLPDPRCTPGANNPQVNQADIGSTICRSGYTSAIRPPEDITAQEKAASASAYGYTGSFHTAEYDHLISLELGGDPNDASNLWVEPNDRPGATSTHNAKDSLENRLNSLVCSMKIPLAEAQQAIATNWAAAYQKYVG